MKTEATKMVTMAGILSLDTPEDFEGVPIHMTGTYNLHVELPTSLVDGIEGVVEDTSPVIAFLFDHVFPDIDKCRTHYQMFELIIDDERHSLVKGQRN